MRNPRTIELLFSTDMGLGKVGIEEGGVMAPIHTHRKKRMVTKLRGHRLWRRVRVAAEVVLLLSTRRPERFLRISLTPILRSRM